MDVNHTLLVCSGDLSLSANHKCWSMQQKMEVDLTEALCKYCWTLKRARQYDQEKEYGFIDYQHIGIKTFRQIYKSKPLIVAESVWQYRHHVPVSLLFLIIAICLYNYNMPNPALLNTIKFQVASEQLGRAKNDRQVILLLVRMLPSGYADKVMLHMIPTGLSGLIVSAILSATMSTVGSGMNASAAVFTEDIYKRCFNPDSPEKNSLRVLYVATVVVGLAGMLCGIAMIGIKSLLYVWWTICGIFAGGMLGLFLLVLSARGAKPVNDIVGARP